MEESISKFKMGIICQILKDSQSKAKMNIMQKVQWQFLNAMSKRYRKVKIIIYREGILGIWVTDFVMIW